MGRWILDLTVSPRAVRVDQGEAARITFTVRDRRGAATGFGRVVAPTIRTMEVIVSPKGRIGGARRTFVWSRPTPGHKVAIWDGTLDGRRNRPPEPGRYRVQVRVSDSSGRRQAMTTTLRVSNAAGRTVLPRTQSGLGLEFLEFDGSALTLLDKGGNELRVRAVSGLRPNNPTNPRHVDYTHPSYQSIPDRGPIPTGVYYIAKDKVQFPDFWGGELRYPTGGTLGQWGPIRVPLRATATRSRFDFLLHLDPADDGTAGCIGVHPDDEGRFNQMMSLLSWMPNDSVPVVVEYGG